MYLKCICNVFAVYSCIPTYSGLFLSRSAAYAPVNPPVLLFKGFSFAALHLSSSAEVRALKMAAGFVPTSTRVRTVSRWLVVKALFFLPFCATSLACCTPARVWTQKVPPILAPFTKTGQST